MDRDDEYDDDRYQEYKDDLAMGRIYEDGTQREPEVPDWYLEQQAERGAERHRDADHGGGECDCPPPEPGPADDDPWSKEPPF